MHGVVSRRWANKETFLITMFPNAVAMRNQKTLFPCFLAILPRGSPCYRHVCSNLRRELSREVAKLENRVFLPYFERVGKPGNIVR